MKIMLNHAKRVQQEEEKANSHLCHALPFSWLWICEFQASGSQCLSRFVPVLQPFGLLHVRKERLHNCYAQAREVLPMTTLCQEVPSAPPLSNHETEAAPPMTELVKHLLIFNRAKHWATLATINHTKELPQNTQLWFNQNLQNSNQKFP